MPLYDSELFTPPAPCVRVTLRRWDTGAALPDVPMLLDSGADVSLIPQASAIALGASDTSAGRYELVGFDGNRSVAQAVELELVFLKRAFKGKFLLINQAWGLLDSFFVTFARCAQKFWTAVAALPP